MTGLRGLKGLVKYCVFCVVTLGNLKFEQLFKQNVRDFSLDEHLFDAPWRCFTNPTKADFISQET